MVYSKKIVLLIILLSTFCNCYSSKIEYDDIWGVWNIGPEENAKIPFGNFLRTWNFLYFTNKYRDEPIIGYDGGHYKIIRIISQNTNSISLYLEHEQTIVDAWGELDTGVVYGKIILHFVDKDHIWLELDYNDNNFPTNRQFSAGDFKGRHVIFWRAKSVE